MKILSELIDQDAISKFTPFQKKVYEELVKIPAGQVITYQELAKKAGNPKAARAVGHAMATNPFVIIIPCHRVINASGEIGNYSDGGPSRKEKLLISEGVKIENGKINQRHFHFL